MSRFYRVIIPLTFCFIVYASLLFFHQNEFRTYGAVKDNLHDLDFATVDETQPFDIIGAFNSGPDRNGGTSTSHQSRCLFDSLSTNITVYFMAMQNSVRIVTLPSSLSHDLRVLCNSLGPKKRAISSHPHSLEMHFPATLIAMTSFGHNGKINSNDSYEGLIGAGFSNDVAKSIRSGDISFHFSPLWIPDSKTPLEKNAISDPLFFYVSALPYHVIYCTNKKNDKEDWSGRDPYWKLVADHLIADKSTNSGDHHTYNPRHDFLLNMGTDFLIPASHPQSGPSRIHPYSVSYLQRATFLKTDLDISGSDKDIVVPYYTKYDAATSPIDEKLPLYAKWCEALTGDALPPFMRPTMIFFAGGDNPINGFRTLFLQNSLALRNRTKPSSSSELGFVHEISKNFEAFLSSATYGRKAVPDTMDDDEIFFSLKSSLTSSEYSQRLLSAKYCLILRGDTTSSKRLFSAVAAGCVPVIISDGLKLPFARIIDYTTFTFTFQESIVHDLKSLFDYLRNVSPVKYVRMRCAMTEARRYLIFDHSSGRVANAGYTKETDNRNTKSSINPVTLTLLQAVMTRETQCLEAQRTEMPMSNMCKKLMLRMQWAREYFVAKQSVEPVTLRPVSEVTS